MGLLDRYVLRTFLLTWLLSAGALLGLITVLDFLGHLDEIGESAALQGPVAGQVLRLYGLQVLFLLATFGPYATLLAGLGTVLLLQRAREWIPMLGAGRSTLRAFLPLYLGAALAAAGIQAVREGVLPSLQAQREALERRLLNQRPWELADLWARGPEDQRLRAGRFLPGGDLAGGPGPSRLQDLELFEILSDGRDRLTRAREAVWSGDRWLLEDGWTLVEGAAEEPARALAVPGLGPQDLFLAYLGRTRPLDLSSDQLQELLERDPHHRQAATLLWASRVAPWIHLVLLLLGLPFALRFDRSSSLEGLGRGLLLCGLFFVADFLCRDLGGRGVLSPWLAGTAPVLAFAGLGLLATERLPT